MDKLIFDILIHPKKEVIARCSKCNMVLANCEYISYFDCQRSQSKMRRRIDKCKKCNAVFFEVPKWEKTQFGWKAKCKEGEFVLYKDGRGWKGHYHTPDDSYFFFLPWRSKVNMLKRVCETNKHWGL